MRNKKSPEARQKLARQLISLPQGSALYHEKRYYVSRLAAAILVPADFERSALLILLLAAVGHGDLALVTAIFKAGRR